MFDVPVSYSAFDTLHRKGRTNLGSASTGGRKPLTAIALNMDANDRTARAVVNAIQTGDVPALQRLLAEDPSLARTHIDSDDRCKGSRTLLHIATDWPGHYPNGRAVVATLVDAGADVNARFVGSHNETPLHWAASSNDVAVLDALLDAGADIEADGGVIGGGAPLADARGFGQWDAARRLVERGARTTLVDAATLGLMDRLEAHVRGETAPTTEAITRAFWVLAMADRNARRAISSPAVPTSTGLDTAT
jgi:uncharacterized protein